LQARLWQCPARRNGSDVQFHKELPEEAGRDSSSLRMIVRANIEISEKPLPKERMIFTGTFEQIQEDVTACKRIGAHELFFDPTFYEGAQTLEDWIILMERLRELG